MNNYTYQGIMRNIRDINANVQSDRELTHSVRNVPKFDYCFMSGWIEILIQDHRRSLPIEGQVDTVHQLKRAWLQNANGAIASMSQKLLRKIARRLPASSSPSLHHNLVLDSRCLVVGITHERAIHQCQGHVDAITRCTVKIAFFSSVFNFVKSVLVKSYLKKYINKNTTTRNYINNYWNENF